MFAEAAVPSILEIPVRAWTPEALLRGISVVPMYKEEPARTEEGMVPVSLEADRDDIHDGLLYETFVYTPFVTVFAFPEISMLYVPVRYEAPRVPLEIFEALRFVRLDPFVEQVRLPLASIAVAKPVVQSVGFEAREVAVEALPIKVAVIVPALKFPEASLKTIVDGVLDEVAFEVTVNVVGPD